MRKEYLYLIITGILYGTIISGGQYLSNLGVSSFEISFYPYILMCAIMLPFILKKFKPIIHRNQMLFFLMFGLVTTMINLSQFFAVALGTPVAVIVFLLHSQPIWTLIIGYFFLKEKITKRKIIAVAVAILGLVILLNPFASGNLLTVGFLLSLVGGMFLAVWIIMSRKSEENGVNHYLNTFHYIFFSSFWLILLYPLLKVFITDSSMIGFGSKFSPIVWISILVYGIISALIPSTLFFKALEKVEASVGSIFLLLEPVSATLIAAFLFGQQLTPNIIVGGLFILLSNYIIMSNDHQHT